MKDWPKLESYIYDNCLTDDIDIFIGKIITKIDIEDICHDPKNSSDIQKTIIFTFDSGHIVYMFHQEDCCSIADIKDIVGDLEDLIGTPILEAECVKSHNEVELGGDSETWTFYKFATIKGSVTIDWLGESNGYYNEEVDLFLVKEPENKTN